MSKQYGKLTYFLVLLLALMLSARQGIASDKDFPPVPVPPRLVNDLAGVLQADQVKALEDKLVAFDKTTSTQITIVTIKNLGGYEIAQYAVELANRWGIGRKSKDNGVLILAAIDDRKVNISTGYGLEGALTDIMCGRIIRNEIIPSFRNGNFYEGFVKGSEAVIAATKGEYTADASDTAQEFPIASLVVLLILIIILIIWLSKNSGGGGGSYMSGKGFSGWEPFIGGALGGSRGRGLGGGGGGGFGGGGFGGFGGGSFGGGGASGSW